MKWINRNKIKCPNCRSVRLYRDGIVGGKQRYHCKKCNKTTVAPKGGSR